ncbi:uncharacterized protein PK2-R2 [Eurosta solidaginis]|uniref:uncharacterized protein PK2-R2 n=1 Tax=Eurosta solidaginis TaxID=178769 RepID=UPI003530ADFD
MFSHTPPHIQLTTVAIVTSVLSRAATSSSLSLTSSSDEMSLLDDDIIQQAYYSNSPIFAFDSSSLVDLQQLLRSDAFKQNMSLTLNISTENLTDLLNTAQLNQTWELPHQQHAMLVLISLSICYVLIILVGVVGNLITCLVIARNKFMHTATNYYLFNLALSDLILLGTGAPQDIYSYWLPNAFPFNDAICILASILSETATNATVLTITAFTVERYIAICHPFRQHTMSKLSRAIKFILAIWMLAVVLALPQSLQFSVVTEPTGTSCTIDNHFIDHVFVLSGCIFFVGPMTAIVVLYALIATKLERSRQLQTASSRNVNSQRRVTRMLFAVAIAFALCWAPFHVQRLMAVYGSRYNMESNLFKTIFDAVDMISGIMYYLSTCINPFLYNIMSHKFREAFKVTFGRRFGFHRRCQSQSHNYSALLRQNGSMRLHTTDSIRTTTTTLSSSTGMGNSVAGINNTSAIRSSLYTSIGSQSPITLHEKTAINKANSTASADAATITQQNHKLQSQLSQRSCGADSNLILDMELCTRHSYCHAHQKSAILNSNRNNNLQHSLISNGITYNGASRKGQLVNGDDLKSISSQEWDSSISQFELSTTHYIDEDDNDSLKEPVSSTNLKMLRHSTITQPVQPLQLVNTIAEVDTQTTARPRLKLSRIISRRDQDALLAQASPRPELMRTKNVDVSPNVPDSPFMAYENDKKKHVRNGTNGGRTHKTLGTLNGLFHWRGRKKELNYGRRGGKKRTRRDTTSATHTHLSRAGTPIPRAALMRSISAAATAPVILESTLNGDMAAQK